jgi:hypothetical protein
MQPASTAAATCVRAAWVPKITATATAAACYDQIINAKSTRWRERTIAGEGVYGVATRRGDGSAGRFGDTSTGQ